MRSDPLAVVLIAILVFSIQAVSASYADPPIQSVSDHNLGLLDTKALENAYDSENATISNVSIHLGAYSAILPVSATLAIAGPSVIIDDSIYPDPYLVILMASGANLSHISFHHEGEPDFICDRSNCAPIGTGCASHCDFDSDFCVEYENNASFIYDLNATLKFKNLSVSVPLNVSYLEIPSQILLAMENSSGADTLDVSIGGNATFLYIINDRQMGYGDACSDRFVNFSSSFPVSMNASFPVAGKNRLFFLKAPILREQWYMNNRFDVVVLSQSPIISSQSFKNGNVTGNITIRSFDIVDGPFGLERIISNQTCKINDSGQNHSANSSSLPPVCAGFSEYRNLTSPYPLSENNLSYAYVYLFSSSYQGIGDNLLSIAIKDSYGRSANYSENITSRMLSYNNEFMENGSAIDPAVSRKSKGWLAGGLSTVQISLGLLSVIVLLLFINSWLMGDKETRK